MYGINTTVEGALAKARKLGIPTLASKYSPSPSPVRGGSNQHHTASPAGASQL